MPQAPPLLSQRLHGLPARPRLPGRAALTNRYATVRPFLALLGETSALGAAPVGARVLAGVRRLPALARRRVKDKPLLPREVDDKLVPAAWRKAVYANPALPQGSVDRDAYVVCVLEQLHRALQRRDVFASPSHRWSDPRARLLDGKEWDAACEDVLVGLSLDMPVEEHPGPRVRPAAMFGREGRPTPLGQAFAEYGRIAKTLHLLAVVDPVDDTYRRQMNRQLTVQESRHKLARAPLG
ncbi:Tn3 family transposase [Streptomyces sp. CL7]|nr:Tn3 family transposase [Streptomyces sp. CL7]WPP32270.1 Tn3 family transposase [Streptomyces sp. CL7]